MDIPEITPCFAVLPERGRTRITGEDARKFLQNIVTNDIDLLDDRPFIHSALLTAQGKYLHDFFIFKEDGGYLIDCEGGDRAGDLARRLSMYKLRSKISITREDDAATYVTLPDLKRSLERPSGISEAAWDIWDCWRIKQGIADGSRDAEIEKSTLAELNMEDAIDYTKGCYVGQELTARIHHRGLLKKRLFPVKFANCAPAVGQDVISAGIKIGEMRSSNGKTGLALLKIDQLPLLSDGFYVIE